MSHLALLMMLRRYRWMYLLILMLSIAIAYFILFPEVMKYESSTTFYYVNENIDNPFNYSQNYSKIINLQDPLQERLFQMTYSTELMEFLINEFNLYDHYGIDTSGIYHHEHIINTLVSNIEFKRVTPDLFTIIVFDRDPKLAANIANTLVVKLDELNRQYLINKLQTNLNFFESYLAESEKMSEDQTRRILYYNEKLKSASEKDEITTPKTDLENSLNQSATSVKEVTTQLILSKALYAKAIMARQAYDTPSLKIVKKAFPNPNSKRSLVIIFSALAGILSCSIVIIVMYFLNTYSQELQIIFGKIPHSD